MWFWWFMLGSDLLIELAMIGGGWVMWKRCPGKNAILGYRTARSMKNDDNWRFANAYCGRLWWKLGWGLLIPIVLLFLLLKRSGEGTLAAAGLIVMVLQLGIILGTIPVTERALKEHENRQGSAAL